MLMFWEGAQVESAVTEDDLVAQPGTLAIAECFKALGHPVRVELLRRILERERCVSQLRGGLGYSQPSISQHLGVLRDHGLVTPVRKGNRTCYRATDERLAELLGLAEALVNPTRPDAASE